MTTDEVVFATCIVRQIIEDFAVCHGHRDGNIQGNSDPR